LQVAGSMTIFAGVKIATLVEHLQSHCWIGILCSRVHGGGHDPRRKRECDLAAEMLA
jgi:hypothetical protein